MKEGVIYAAMKEGDIPGVLSLQEECGLEYWSEESYREALKSNDFVIYIAKSPEKTSKALGFILARLITSGDFCEILNIAVSVNHRYKKIGEGLLLTLLSGLDSNIHKIWLEVREGNHPAIAFYRKHEFVSVGIRRNFYHDPVENAILMEKMLD